MGLFYHKYWGVIITNLPHDRNDHRIITGWYAHKLEYVIPGKAAELDKSNANVRKLCKET